MRCVITRVLPEPAPARTSSGPSVVSDGLPLRGIQLGEVLLGGGDGHAVDATEGQTGLAVPELGRSAYCADRFGGRS